MDFGYPKLINFLCQIYTHPILPLFLLNQWIIPKLVVLFFFLLIVNGLFQLLFAMVNYNQGKVGASQNSNDILHPNEVIACSHNEAINNEYLQQIHVSMDSLFLLYVHTHIIYPIFVSLTMVSRTKCHNIKQLKACWLTMSYNQSDRVMACIYNIGSIVHGSRNFVRHFALKSTVVLPPMLNELYQDYRGSE